MLLLIAAHPAHAPAPLRLPLYLCAVAAGFPSPAEEYVEEALDLNAHLVTRPAATFFVRARGDSMAGAGIFDGDILVVDRSVDPTAGRVVIAALDGLLTVKRLQRSGDRLCLAAASDGYAPIPLNDGVEVVVWGVVVAVVRKL